MSKWTVTISDILVVVFWTEKWSKKGSKWTVTFLVSSDSSLQDHWLNDVDIIQIKLLSQEKVIAETKKGHCPLGPFFWPFFRSKHYDKNVWNGHCPFGHFFVSNFRSKHYENNVQVDSDILKKITVHLDIIFVVF